MHDCLMKCSFSFGVSPLSTCIACFFQLFSTYTTKMRKSLRGKIRAANWPRCWPRCWLCSGRSTLNQNKWDTAMFCLAQEPHQEPTQIGLPSILSLRKKSLQFVGSTSALRSVQFSLFESLRPSHISWKLLTDRYLALSPLELMSFVATS